MGGSYLGLLERSLNKMKILLTDYRPALSL